MANFFSFGFNRTPLYHMVYLHCLLGEKRNKRTENETKSLQTSCCNSLASRLTPNFHEEFTSGLVSSSVACLVQHLVPAPGKGSTGVFVVVDPQLHRRAIKVILEHRIVPRDTYIVFISLLLYVLGARGNTWTLFI